MTSRWCGSVAHSRPLGTLVITTPIRSQNAAPIRQDRWSGIRFSLETYRTRYVPHVIQGRRRVAGGRSPSRRAIIATRVSRQARSQRGNRDALRACIGRVCTVGAGLTAPAPVALLLAIGKPPGEWLRPDGKRVPCVRRLPACARARDPLLAEPISEPVPRGSSRREPDPSSEGRTRAPRTARSPRSRARRTRHTSGSPVLIMRRSRRPIMGRRPFNASSS